MKRFVGLLGVCLIVSVAFAANYLVEGGKIHYREGRFEKADSLFKEAITRGMKPVQEAYLWHAKTSLRLEDAVSSAAAFDTLVTMYDDGLTWINEDEEAQGMVQIALYYGAQEVIGDDDPDNTDIAVSFLKRAIELDPTRIVNYVFLSRIYLDGKRLDEADALAVQLAEVEPTSPDLYYLVGRIAFAKAQSAKGDTAGIYYKEATEAFEQSTAGYLTVLDELLAEEAAKLTIEDSVLLEMIGVAKEVDQSNIADSLKLQQQADRLAADFGLREAFIKQFLGWYPGYVGKSNQIADAYNYLGQTYLQNSQYVDPDDTVETRQAQYEKASEALGHSLEYDPANLITNYYKGLSLYYLKEYSAALEYLGPVLEAAPDDYYVNVYTGRCYMYQEEPDCDIGAEILEHAVEIDDEIPDAYRDLVILYDKCGNKDKAEEWAKKYDDLTKQQGGN